MKNVAIQLLLFCLATVFFFKLMKLLLNFAWLAFVFAYIINPVLVFIVLPATLLYFLCQLIDKRRLKATA